MAEWQKNELASEEDLKVVVAMTENNDMETPTPEDLLEWQAYFDLECTMLADPDMAVKNMYVEGNPDNVIGNAATLLIDRSMTIRKVSGAFEEAVTLEDIQALLSE